MKKLVVALVENDIEFCFEDCTVRVNGYEVAFMGEDLVVLDEDEEEVFRTNSLDKLIELLKEEL